MQARAKAAAPTRDTSGAERGLGEGDSEDSSEEVDSSGDVAASSGVGGSEMTFVGKEMVRLDQSTNGLKAVSQLSPKTAVEGESSLVT